MLRYSKNATPSWINKKYPFFLVGVASGYVLSYLNVKVVFLIAMIVVYLVGTSILTRIFPHTFSSLGKRKRKLDDDGGSYSPVATSDNSADIESGNMFKLNIDSDLLHPGWLNDALEMQWDFIREATIKSMRATLDPIFEKNTPSYLSYLRLKNVELGDVPPLIKRVWVEKEDSDTPRVKRDDELDDVLIIYADIQSTRGTVKFDVETDSAGPVNLSRLTGNPVLVTIENIKFAGTLRIELSGKCGSWPTFQTLACSFAIRPRFRFDITVAGLTIPGVKDFMKDFIGGTLIKTFVYPAQMKVNIGNHNHHVEEEEAAYLDRFCVLCRNQLETKDPTLSLNTGHRSLTPSYASNETAHKML